MVFDLRNNSFNMQYYFSILFIFWVNISDRNLCVYRINLSLFVIHPCILHKCSIPYSLHRQRGFSRRQREFYDRLWDLTTSCRKRLTEQYLSNQTVGFNFLPLLQNISYINVFLLKQKTFTVIFIKI